MLVNPANTDGLEILEAMVYDLRDLYSIAPSPAAMPKKGEDDEDDEDEESGDDADDSDDDSEKDSDESDDEDDEDEDDKASTAKLIKDLREENKARRLRLRSVTKERDALKAENARLKRQGKGSNTRKKVDDADEEDDEQDDPTKLNPREEAAEIKSALVDVMSDLDLGKRYRRIIAALIDPDEIELEISDTGKVTVSGLKEAVEELLEDYPEWQDKVDDSDEDDGGKTRRISSGNRKKKTTSNGLDKASLAKKFPALASR